MASRNMLVRYNCIFNKKFLIPGVAEHFAKSFWMKKFQKTQVRWLSPAGGPGIPGSGAGRGGGGGGSVRESGGGLGQLGAAREEEFFYNKQREQLKKIKQKLKEVPSDNVGDLSQKEEK